MKSKYFAALTSLLAEVRPGLAVTHRLAFKNVFGAVAGYVNDRIFISFGTFGLAVRLPPQTLGRLFTEKGVKRLRYFPNGHVKKEYAVLPRRMIGDRRQFKKLINQSIEYALSC